MKFLAVIFLPALISLYTEFATAEDDAHTLLQKHGVFKNLTANQIQQATKSGLWNPAGTAFAFCIKKSKVESHCYVVDDEGAVDTSAVESGNLGKLGLYPRDTYEKVITFPTGWHDNSDFLKFFTGSDFVRTPERSYYVIFTTQAWREGQRYTVHEPASVSGGAYHGR